jgi:flagellin-like protein
MAILGNLIVAAAPVAQGGPLTDPLVVRRTAQEVLARPEYQLDAPPDFSEVFNLIWNFFLSIIEFIQGIFRWLWAISPPLALLVFFAMVVTACLLLGHIIWTLMAVLSRERRTIDSLADSKKRKVDPAELAREADEASASGNYILGVRLLYRACLARLEQVELKPFRPGATNREHLDRYRGTTLYDWLYRFVSIIDLKWYGPEPCLATDFAECRDAYQRICRLAPGRAHAHPA